ncbi:hypothetical protein, partial [Rhizobium laguerreae]|uniref:hypothetical protein n=1 Tax=Rhizobium laguerreae TaxID=1076926 RepID=UPI001C90A773
MWRRLKRIPDLAVAVELSGDDNARVAQVGKLKFDSVDVAMCCRPEAERAEPIAPNALFGMIETDAAHIQKRCTGDSHLAAPVGRTIAILYPRAAETDPHIALTQAPFGMQIALPHHAVAVEKLNFLPAGVAEQAVRERLIELGVKHLAHEMFALGQNCKTPFTGRGKSAPRPKRSANAGTVETVGDDAGEPPACTEGSGG